jgi:hypothetical protein
MYEILKDFAGPVATFIASVTAAWVTWHFGSWQAKIARQQADLAEERVKLDKFDRRFAVFDATRELIRIVMQQSHADQEQIFDFRIKQGMPFSCSTTTYPHILKNLQTRHGIFGSLKMK